MKDSEILYDVLIFLVAAVVVVPAFRRLRTSPVLGYLAAGILVGPHGLAVIRDSESAHTLAEFGVVFLLFMIGLEFSAERLRALGHYVFGLGALQVTVTGCLIGGVAWALGATEEAAIIIGGGLALSSTAFVLQLLIERGERATSFGNISFAVLLFQDLAIVPLLMLVSLLGEGEGTFITAMGMAVVKAAVALLLVVGVGRLILRPVYRIIAETRSSELFVATTLLVILGTGWLMSLVGISMVLGAFLAGILLSETEYRHQVEADIRPFRGILLGLFFMSVGMSIDIALIWSELAQITLLVIGLMVGKSIVTAALCRGFGLPVSVSVRVGLLLSQGGEFGFILFLTASTLGLLAAETTQILLASVALTMVATPLMAYAGSQFSSFWARHEKVSVAGVEQIGEDLHDHVLIAGFGRVGQTVAKMLSAGGISYAALDLDATRIAACRAKGMPVFFGDAGQIEILSSAGASRARGAVVTIDQPATADGIVAALHEFFPDLPIFVRAQDLLHGRRLETEGAIQAVPETLEASLQLGAIAMTSMGTNSDEVVEIVEELRSDDYIKLGEIIHG
ncbi:MAG: potassium transporter KefB [Rhodospirillaceae bacterium]|nr:potassium transporter KefB [Rhodospirillaceae bacterium]MBT3495291.1 potassium transporter KefB [Rhodospirillaceae bacterium]MBT3781934.1 potassium transporter KefB [Rhodospirillaceae bacterium]MBT3979648.1 potassium transporter KefB [Rhodospirillaceae bacterium]MBT4167991.1 potassium transporter KefB [Rhodospirillaceae bacterium]